MGVMQDGRTLGRVMVFLLVLCLFIFIEVQCQSTWESMRVKTDNHGPIIAVIDDMVVRADYMGGYYCTNVDGSLY